MLAIRDGDWKLLMNPDLKRIELYDLKKDPTQLNSVSEHHPDEIVRLTERLLAWQKELPPGPTDPGVGQMSYPWPGKAKAATPAPTGAKKKRGTEN
jgi:hypothetical protein